MSPDTIPRNINLDDLKMILFFMPQYERELVVEFLQKSNHPTAVHLRDRLKMARAKKLDAAIKRQEKLSKKAREIFGQGRPGDMKRIAILDPDFKAEFEAQHGRTVWNDPAATKDTKQHHPKLFLE